MCNFQVLTVGQRKYCDETKILITPTDVTQYYHWNVHTVGVRMPALIQKVVSETFDDEINVEIRDSTVLLVNVTMFIGMCYTVWPPSDSETEQ